MTSPGKILVTGGAKRIGAALSTALVASGWKVVLHYNQAAEDAEMLSGELLAKGGREITHASDRVVDAMNESRTGLDALRRDVVRLADDVRGEVGMSRAIELARGGATKQAVADATGLSLEEAEAIVTFHGRK